MPDNCRIQVVHFPGDILCGTNDLMVCLAQTPPPCKEDIRDGKASPMLMPFLKSLFDGIPEEGVNSRLVEMLPDPTRFVLILIPEFAISFPNWNSLDEMVRRLQRPAIIIGGIGVVLSSDLKRWKEEQAGVAGTTQRVCGFQDQAVNGAGTIKYNVGCCWIHQPEQGTKCIFFLKNYLERASEAINIHGLIEGQHLLCIKANDLHIYPLICAEITSNQAAAKPIERIKKHIEVEAVNTNILIAGIAYETNSSHPFWARGIRESVQICPNGKIITVIVNNALDPYYPDEVKDKWRCLSGVFTKRLDDKDQQAQPPSRSLYNDDAMVGVVCRTGEPQTISGKISWDLARAGDRFLWRTTHRTIANGLGILQEVDLGDLHNDELCRAIKRFSPHAGSTKSNNQIAALTEVNNHLMRGDQPNAKTLLDSLMLGLRANTDSGFDPDMLFEIREYLISGLCVLGAIKQKASCLWQKDISNSAQLLDDENKVHILVWSDPRHTRLSIFREVENWARDFQHKRPLLVVANGSGGEFESVGIVKATRRGDITSSGGSDITIPRAVCRKAYILRMGDVENCIEDTNVIAAINTLFEQPLRELVQ